MVITDVDLLGGGSMKSKFGLFQKKNACQDLLTLYNSMYFCI